VSADALIQAMTTPIEDARKTEDLEGKANSRIGLVIRLILFLIAAIWFVVGLFVYLRIMTSTHE
jgi:hypothetical protein